MVSVNMSNAQVQSLGSLVKAAEPKDSITPVISAARLVLSGNRMTATATDRYVVVEVGFELESALEGESVTFLPYAADLAEIAKRVRALKIQSLGDVIRFEFSESRLKAFYTIDESVIGEFSLLEGANFPPVDRLFPEPGFSNPPEVPVAIKPYLLANIASVYPAEMSLESARE